MQEWKNYNKDMHYRSIYGTAVAGLKDTGDYLTEMLKKQRLSKTFLNKSF